MNDLQTTSFVLTHWCNTTMCLLHAVHDQPTITITKTEEMGKKPYVRRVSQHLLKSFFPPPWGFDHHFFCVLLRALEEFSSSSSKKRDVHGRKHFYSCDFAKGGFSSFRRRWIVIVETKKHDHQPVLTLAATRLTTILLQ